MVWDSNSISSSTESGLGEILPPAAPQPPATFYSQEQMSGMLEQLKAYPDLQTQVINTVTQDGIQDPQVIASLIDSGLQTISQQPLTIEQGPEPAYSTGISGGIDLGSTTEALAFNPPPLPNVPDVRADIGIDTGRDDQGRA